MVEDSYEAHGMACEVKPIQDHFVKGAKTYKKIPQVSITNNGQEYWTVKNPVYGNLTLWNGDPLYKSWYH